MMLHERRTGSGRGFSFNVPADTTPRTLTFYCATNADAGAVLQINASLSDGSASAFVDSFANPGKYQSKTWCARLHMRQPPRGKR